MAGAPAQTQIMYGIGGEQRLTEVELPWLPGYEGSRPVRIVYESRKYGLPARPDAWDQLLVLVDFVEQNWQRPDEGIWEIRGARQLHFTYSKLMAWVALDRAVRLIEEFDVGGKHRLGTRPSTRASS